MIKKESVMKKLLLSALFMSVVSMTAFADSLVSNSLSVSGTVDASSLNEIRLIGTLNGDSHNFSCMVNFNDNSSHFNQKPYVTVGDLIADLEIWYPGMDVILIALDTTDNDAPQPTDLDTNDGPQLRNLDTTDNDAPQNTTSSDTTDNDAPQPTDLDTNDGPQLRNLDTTDNDAPQNTTSSEKYTFRGTEVSQDSKIEDLNLTNKSVFFMEYVATPVQASGTATVQASSVS